LEGKLVYEYSFPLKHHWWIDSGLVGLYNIAIKLKNDKAKGNSIACFVDADRLTFQAPSQKVLADFFDDCYQELANRYWNVSTRKQREDNDLVVYDRETNQLRLIPKRKATPIPGLFIKGSSYRADGIKYADLSVEMRDKVDKFLKEKNKKLWGAEKKLLFEPTVSHPLIKLFPPKGKKSTCCICGQESICSEVSQPSFFLFASQTATLSFNSEGKNPDKICWECEFLSKFAIEAAHYKQFIKNKKPERLYILQISAANIEKMINIHSLLGAQSTLRQLDEENYFSNIGTIKMDNRLLFYARLPYELLWAFFHDTYNLLRTEAEKHTQSMGELTMLCLKPIIEIPVQVILIAIDYKGKTFITKDIISYTETAYAFRLVHSLHNEFAQDHKFLLNVFRDLNLPTEGSPFDVNNNLWRNRILQRVLQKKTILQSIESFVFRKSIVQEFPYLGNLLNFTKSYQLKIQEGNGMTEDQVEVAVNLGKQIVFSAKDSTKNTSQGNFDRVKGDLFALRKTRTAGDFLEQLNRIQFRYNIVVSNQLLSGVLEKVSFPDFKSYCLLSALNTYNNLKRPPKENKDKE
jgi:hypothetical protein